MDGLITIIIFFIISSLFSGNKNQKKRPKRDIDSEIKKEKHDVSRNVQKTSNKSLLTEIRAARDKMLAETENIKKSQPSRTLENKVEILKNAPSERIPDKKSVVKKSLIPQDHISQEGFSANPEYIYEGDIELSDEIIRNSINQPKKLFDNKADLKRAIILKEVLDKPLSLRAGR